MLSVRKYDTAFHNTAKHCMFDYPVFLSQCLHLHEPLANMFTAGLESISSHVLIYTDQSPYSEGKKDSHRQGWGCANLEE